jgi:hypothetical protein
VVWFVLGRVARGLAFVGRRWYERLSGDKLSWEEKLVNGLFFVP